MTSVEDTVIREGGPSSASSSSPPQCPSSPSPSDTPPAPLFVYQYSIIKSILEHLPILELLNVGKVCKEWNRVGQLVRRKRKNEPTTFLWHPYGLDHTSEVFEYFSGVNVSSAATAFITNAPGMGLGLPSVQELTEEQSWSPLFPTMRAALLKDFSTSFYEPQLMIVVATAAVDEYMPSDEDNRTKLKIILSEIPRAIPCLVTISFGIVASLKGEPKSLEMENSEVPMIAGLNIPKVPGMTVKMFTCTKETNAKYKVKGSINSETCKEILNIQEGDKVKGIILFHTDMRKAGALKEAVIQYLKDNPHVALGGGSHYKNLASVCEGDFVPIGAGLIICGDDNVNVASIGFFKSKVDVKNEEKLVEVKKYCEFQGGSSFAFMFACNGRGSHMHGATNVECSVFRKHFPQTHLIGTFTGGEYCHEVIPGNGKQYSPPSKHSNIEFAYTTVFVYVSYRHPKEKGSGGGRTN